MLMSFTSFAVGDDFILNHNCQTKVPKSGYTPVAGHLVIIDTSIANGVDVCAVNENPYGIITWVAPDATYCTVAEFLGGTTIVLPFSGSVALGDKVECDGAALAATGTSGPSRGVVRTDNSNGVGVVIATGSSSPAGTGTCVVRFS
jgi:hypothetical protein